MARSPFLRGLAIVYLIAFISLLLQVNGLIGSNGILPVSDYLDTIDSEYGNTGYALFSLLLGNLEPTLRQRDLRGPL